MTVVRDDDLHPPDDLRLFPMPNQASCAWTTARFVAVMGYGDTLLWHYSFADHWFHIMAGRRVVPPCRPAAPRQAACHPAR
jgi:hypothetical protein